MYLSIHIINLAYADEVILDKAKISLGAYALTRYDSSVSLTEPKTGTGVSVSPEDTLGLNTRQTVVRLDGYYRFNKQHGLTYSWYSINSDGNKNLDEQFEWVDDNGDTITIPVGAQVTSSLGYDIYKLGYLWSFHHTDKVELAVGAGLHWTRLDLQLLSDTTSSGLDAQDVSTSIPLPVMSFVMTYSVTPKFLWSLKTEFFAMSFDDWDGNYTDSTLGAEYRLHKNFGLGLGYGSNALKLSENTNKYKFNFENRISGLRVFVSAYF